MFFHSDKIFRWTVRKSTTNRRSVRLAAANKKAANATTAVGFSAKSFSVARSDSVEMLKRKKGQEKEKKLTEKEKFYAYEFGTLDPSASAGTIEKMFVVEVLVGLVF